eukprot:3669856-Rhodomonas_salina.1
MQLIIVTYVDDLQLVYHKRDEKLAEDVISAFRERFDITDEGNFSWHLGIHYTRDCDKRLTTASQQLYLETVLERLGFENLKPRNTPMVAGQRLTKASDDELLRDEEVTEFREQL